MMHEIEKANVTAVDSCHRVIETLLQPLGEDSCKNLADQTGEAVGRFKRVVSLLDSSCGHARVRKSQHISTPVDFRPHQEIGNSFKTVTTPSLELKNSHSKTFPLSSLSLDGSVTDSQGSGLPLGGNAPSADQSSSDNLSVRGVDGSCKCGSSGSGTCHCSKMWWNRRVKWSIKVPAVIKKFAYVPLAPDDYSWRKYGQNWIKGSPHPRGHFKCISVRGCRARKHVERCLEDPSMLNVTYEGEHSHPKLPSQTADA